MVLYGMSNNRLEMRTSIALAIITLLAMKSFAQEPVTTFKVMAWNILHGGNDIEKGPENVVKIIQAINPDVVLMVETYGSGKKIADALGYHFHLIAPEGTALDDESINLSIFSKYPFGERIDTEYPFYLGGREIFIEDQSIRFLSNWFHYTPWYDEPHKMGMNAKELLDMEKTGSKYEMIQKVLPYIEKYAAESDSIPFIIGGDFNTPSHLDWGEETKGIHDGLVVPWYATKVLEDLGLTDTYRALNPDVLRHPGITWNTKGKSDSHRIDYIFYKGRLLNPLKSKTYHEYINEPIRIGDNGPVLYPSDHGIVVTEFEITD